MSDQTITLTNSGNGEVFRLGLEMEIQTSQNTGDTVVGSAADNTVDIFQVVVGRNNHRTTVNHLDVRNTQMRGNQLRNMFPVVIVEQVTRNNRDFVGATIGLDGTRNQTASGRGDQIGEYRHIGLGTQLFSFQQQ